MKNPFFQNISVALGQCRVLSMRTIPVAGKRGKLSGSGLSTISNTVFRNAYVR